MDDSAQPMEVLAEVPTDALRKPASVADHAGMSALWDTVVGTGRFFKPEDGPFVEQLVFLLEEARQCRMNCVDDYGNIQPMVGKGEPLEDGSYLDYKENPWMRAMRDANQQALKLAEMLGLTPMARARLGLTAATGKTMLSIADQIDSAMRRAEK
jgi:P27 family predicted phage terminase small subunit